MAIKGENEIEKHNKSIVMPENHLLDTLNLSSQLGSYIDALNEHLIVNEVYPANIELNVVNRVIIVPRVGRKWDGPNGEKDQYIVMLAKAYPRMAYTMRNIVNSQAFPLMLPTKTAKKMFSSLPPYRPLGFYASQNKIYELHFRKLNKQKYEAVYFAEVTPKDSDIFPDDWGVLQKIETFSREMLWYHMDGYDIKTSRIKIKR